MTRRVVRPGIRRLFRLALRRQARVETELVDELLLHVELRAAQLVARGMPAEAARAEALRRLGFSSIDQARRPLDKESGRTTRRSRLRDWGESIAQDVRLSLRQLARRPQFVGAVVATLGIALAAAATMFGVVDRLLVRPPPHVIA